MEANLTMSMRCTSEAQRDFVQLMLSNDADRPLFEGDVATSERKWFIALEDVQTPEWMAIKGTDVVHAGWTIGGWEWEDDVKEILQCLKRAKVDRAFSVVAGDEGWYELWLLQNGKITRQAKWQGKSLTKLFEGKDDLAAVLDGIME